jgi:hypothetical protein
VGSCKWEELVFRFSNSGVVPTITSNPGLAAELSPKQDKHPPTFYSSKIVQSVTLGFKLLKVRQPSVFQWILNLKDELGMPDNALLRHLEVEGAAFGVRWREYYLRLLGMAVEQPVQSQVACPFWRITDAKGTDIEFVQVWFQRVSCLSSPVYGDVRWHPDRGKTEILTNLENRNGWRDVRAAVRGLTLLQKINFQGRPVDSGTLTISQFIERAPQAYRKLLDMFGENPSVVDVAAELDMSRPTFYRYMEGANLSLSQIRDVALRINIDYPAPF